MKNIAVSLSLVFLGISIMVGAWIIASSINYAHEQELKSPPYTEKQLMNESELQEYLGINREELARMMPKKDEDMTSSQLPYIQIEHEYYYPVKAIDLWLTKVGVEVFR